MKIRLLIIPLLVAVAIAAASQSTVTNDANAAGTPDTHVAHWDAAATNALNVSTVPFVERFAVFAYLGIAIYDSTVAIEGGWEPFMVDMEPPAGASAEAAVASAAATILSHYVPGAGPAAVIGTAYTDALAGIPDGASKTDGLAFGAAVAQGVIAQRAGDGFFTPAAPYVNADPPIPGVFVAGPVPPAPVGPLGRIIANMTPFVLSSDDQLRPGGPPALNTGAWANEYNEVKAIGAADSSSRTSEQTIAALFWAENPIVQAQLGFRNFILERDLDIVDASRFMALLSVVRVDAMIACFDAKYHYSAWRPVTAIPAGDTDGNPKTIGDPDWTPLIATPNHPEYPSAHSCVTPASARVIAQFVGSAEIHYTIPSLTGLGDRYYRTFQDLSYEVGEARVWGGIHFRSAIRDGELIAKQVVGRVLEEHFEPAD